jgi:hypothetical protein
VARRAFELDRWIRFSATGAHLCWRVKNAAKSVPFKTLKTLPDGSELVLLHESDSMPGKRRRDIADGTAPRLPDTVARLVQFTVTTRTRSGRVKTSVIRVLTTLLDHAGFPAAEIAALYAERFPSYWRGGPRNGCSAGWPEPGARAPPTASTPAGSAAYTRSQGTR